MEVEDVRPDPEIGLNDIQIVTDLIDRKRRDLAGDRSPAQSPSPSRPSPPDPEIEIEIEIEIESMSRNDERREYEVTQITPLYLFNNQKNGSSFSFL